MKHNKLEMESGKFFRLQPQEAVIMDITLRLDPTVVLFYTRIANANELPLEQVLSDALFKLAGELSLQALKDG